MMCHQRIRFVWESVVVGLLLLATTKTSSAASKATFSSRLTATTRFGSNNNNDNLSFVLGGKNTKQSAFLDPTKFPRGGGAIDEDDEESDSEDEYDEMSEDEEDDEDLFGGLEENDFETAESEFAEADHVQRILQAWKTTPPLTKGYLSASFVATAYGYLACKNEFPPILALEWKAVTTKFQIWRLFTAFLNFGQLGLGYAMTAHFVWTYMSTLERLHHSNPYDFWIMIGFGVMSMVIGYPLLKLSPKLLGHNLSTFMVYIWARFHEGLECNMFELFNTRAELLPWFFLAQTFLLEGEPPVLDFLGIVFGHIYHHLKTVGVLRAPPSLVAWYKSDSGFAKDLRSKYKTIGEDFELLGGAGGDD